MSMSYPVVICALRRQGHAPLALRSQRTSASCWPQHDGRTMARPKQSMRAGAGWRVRCGAHGSVLERRRARVAGHRRSRARAPRTCASSALQQSASWASSGAAKGPRERLQSRAPDTLRLGCVQTELAGCRAAGQRAHVAVCVAGPVERGRGGRMWEVWKGGRMWEVSMAGSAAMVDRPCTAKPRPLGLRP